MARPSDIESQRQRTRRQRLEPAFSIFRVWKVHWAFQWDWLQEVRRGCEKGEKWWSLAAMVEILELLWCLLYSELLRAD